MAKDKIEEETYTLILTSLKHPLRRKILRILSEKPLSYSEILEALEIDSGHLNYHIKNLGEIVTRTKDGKYALSSVGFAAVKLMSKIEEQDASTKANKRVRRISNTATIFSVIFAAALLTATVYTVTFTTEDQGVLFGPTQEFEGIPIILQTNQTFKYTITLNQLSDELGHTYTIRQNETLIEISPSRNDFSHWTEYSSESMLRVNGTYEVAITIYNPSGKIIGSHTEAGVNLISTENIPLKFEFTSFGTYILEIENLRPGEFNAVLIPYGVYMDYEKPLFNFGIAAIIVLVLYPIIFFLAWNWSKVQAWSAAS